MIFIVIIVILLLALAVLLYDFLPDFMNWVGRIGTGKVADDAEWLENVREINMNWVSKGAPKVPYDENKRLKLIDTVKNFGSISTVAYWQEAALLKAATKKCGSDVKDDVNDLVIRFIDDITGEWKKTPDRIDAAILAYEMMSNEFVNTDDIRPAMDYIARMLKELYDEYGFIPYNKNDPKTRLVDTVGMVCPFLIKYALRYNKPEYLDIAVEQITQYREYGFDSETKMPFHGYDNESKAKLGICGWGRGCAWWTLGLTDSLKELMSFSGGCLREKTEISRLIVEILNETEKYVGKGGAVRRMIFNNSHPDSSATAMYAYCYAYMYSLSKNDKYRECSERMLKFLKSVTRRSGVIDFSQGDTMGIGYYSSGVSVIPAAQGFTCAAAELLNK